MILLQFGNCNHCLCLIELDFQVMVVHTASAYKLSGSRCVMQLRVGHLNNHTNLGHKGLAHPLVRLTKIAIFRAIKWRVSGLEMLTRIRCLIPPFDGIKLIGSNWCKPQSSYIPCLYKRVVTQNLCGIAGQNLAIVVGGFQV